MHGRRLPARGDVKTCACGCPLPARPNGRYASDACRARHWKERNDYGRGRAASAVRTPRRPSRDGKNVRLSITPAECEALARGEALPNVVRKAAAKLKPPAPMPGQTDLIEALAEVEAERIAT